MSWQTLAKNHAIAEINLSGVLEAGRFDAEYFDPMYLSALDKITQKNSKSIKSQFAVRVFSGPFGSFFKSENYQTSGHPFVRISDIKDLFLDKESMVFVNGDDFEKLKKYRLDINDIVFSKIGTVGRLSIITKDIGAVAISENNIGLAFSSKVKEEDKAYIAFFLLSSYGQRQIMRMASGNIQLKLNVSDIKNILLPKPTEKMKQWLSDALKSINNFVLSSSQKYAEAEQLLLKEINLPDYKPSEKNISVRSLVECLKDDRFDAEYWQPDFDAIQNAIKKHKDGFDTLNKLFELSEKKTRIEPEKEYLYAELADVNSASGTIDNFTALLGKELPSRGRMALKKNDIIVSSVEGSLEKVALVLSDEKNIIGSTGFFVLRQKVYEPEVALVLLKSRPIQQLLKRQAQGTILTAIPKASLSRVLLPKVGKSAQGQIKEKIAQSHKERQEAKNLLEKAKRAVEIFIEQDEKQALAYLNQ